MNDYNNNNNDDDDRDPVQLCLFKLKKIFSCAYDNIIDYDGSTYRPS